MRVVRLTDITPNRATVLAVYDCEEGSLLAMIVPYSRTLVSLPDGAPDVHERERVWVETAGGFVTAIVGTSDLA